MKKTIIILFLFIFSMGFVNGLTKVEEDYNSGNFFYRILKLKEGELQGGLLVFRGFTQGYIRGVWNSFEDIYWDSPKCMNYGQIEDIVENYLEAHPETRHEYIKYLIVTALLEKLPTPKVPILIYNPEWEKKAYEKK